MAARHNKSKCHGTGDCEVVGPVAAGQVANVLGTLIVKGKHIQIDGTLNGNGGGYPGAVPNVGAGGTGKSPPGTNGGGTGGPTISGGSASKSGGYVAVHCLTYWGTRQIQIPRWKF